MTRNLEYQGYRQGNNIVTTTTITTATPSICRRKTLSSVIYFIFPCANEFVFGGLKSIYLPTIDSSRRKSTFHSILFTRLFILFVQLAPHNLLFRTLIAAYINFIFSFTLFATVCIKIFFSLRQNRVSCPKISITSK